MAQEVQTTLNYQAELNETEGIGYQERRISDKMQVRDKFSSCWEGTTNITPADNYVKPTSWTVLSTPGNDIYKVKGGDIVIPLAGAYLVEFLPWQTFSQYDYPWVVAFFVNGKEAYISESHYAVFREWIGATLNLGRKDVLTIGIKKVGSLAPYGDVGLKITKL